MNTLTRFGTGDLTYYFTPSDQVAFNTNFSNAVPQTTRLPGVSGGLDEYGAGVAPTEIGNVSVTFWLFFTTPSEKTTKIDTLNRIQSWGVQRLFLQPTDSTAGERYCEARINNIEISENVKDMPSRRMRVRINFQVANPVWLAQGTEAPRFDTGVLFDSGAKFGGSAPANAISGTSTDISIDRPGSAITYPRITVSCDTGETMENIRIQRIVNSTVVETLGYTGTLTAGDSLEIDCRAKSVKLNAVSAYSAAITFTTAAWFSLLPGVQTVRVLCDNAGDAGTIYLRYFEAYL